MSEPVVRYEFFDSPLGQLLLAGSGDALQLISFPAGSRARKPEPDWRRDEGLFRHAAKQLEEYFGGERRTFSLALDYGGTPFQHAYWTLLLSVPFGETTTYGTLARRLGRPKASRAVGAANGANPIPIIIPCHRVIGTNGALTGFGGGIETKRYLLSHEARLAKNDEGEGR